VHAPVHRLANRTSDSKFPGMFISSQTAAVGARRVSASSSPASSQAAALGAAGPARNRSQHLSTRIVCQTFLFY